MRRFVLALGLLIAACCGERPQPASPTPVPLPPLPAVLCDQALSRSVYSEDRLRKSPLGCVGVTGTIIRYALSDDGDLVMDFQVTEDFNNPTYLNEFNKSGNNGFLVVEFVCQGKTNTPKESSAACQTYLGPKIDLGVVDYLVATKAKVRIDGILVRDMNADHLWIELHPATRILQLSLYSF